jgi:hypothetical protein
MLWRRKQTQLPAPLFLSHGRAHRCQLSPRFNRHRQRAKREHRWLPRTSTPPLRSTNGDPEPRFARCLPLDREVRARFAQGLAVLAAITPLWPVVDRMDVIVVFALVVRPHGGVRLVNARSVRHTSARAYVRLDAMGAVAARPGLRRGRGGSRSTCNLRRLQCLSAPSTPSRSCSCLLTRPDGRPHGRVAF